MGNNVLVIQCLFIFFALFCALDGASVKNWCPLPAQLKSNYDFDWTSKSFEWNNTNAKTSYLLLVLSWTPTFCNSLPVSARNKEFQCMNDKHFDLVVHGLWPQTAKASSVRNHPRNCRNEKQLNATFIKRYYCMMPDEDLIQAEWEKHGTCYYKTATDYYTAMENLYQSLNIPDLQSLTSLTATNVKNAFLMSNSKLFSSAIQVSMNADNLLKEIKICYNLNHQLVSC